MSRHLHITEAKDCDSLIYIASFSTAKILSLIMIIKSKDAHKPY